MALIDVLRSGVKTADKVTKSFQSNVSYQRVTARDAYGEPSAYSSAVTVKAVVDFRSVPVRDKQGITVYASATITILDAAEVSRITSGQGVDTDDVFILADGTKSKVLSIGGFLDPSSTVGKSKPIPTTVMIG